MIAMEAAGLAAPLLAFFVAAASPGPATLAVAATAMAKGRAAACRLSLGLALGITIWGTLTAVGLGALILTWAPALIFLKLAGGIYLLFLAWGSARSAMRTSDTDGSEQPAIAPQRLFLSGLILNLMNPKAVLAWAAVISLGLPETGVSTYLLAVCSLCVALTVAIYMVYSVLFAIPPIRAAYVRGRRVLEGAFALGFAAAGLRLLFWRSESA